MRILRVAPWIYPDTKGGGEYHVHAMSRDQAAMDHDVTVLTTQEDESLPRIEKTHGYTIVRVSPGVTLLGNDVSPAVARYLWHEDGDSFDMMHAHSHCYFVTNLAALKRRFGEIPMAITNHGLYSQNVPERLFSLYLKTVGRWTFNQADVIFCYTDVDKERVGELGVTSQIEVVSNGIDTERFTPEGPKSELIDAEGPVVLFVGRFTEGKRPWLAVEAFAEMLAEYPDAELYLCGDGALRKDLEAQVEELAIADAVTFLGYVPYDDMPKVYRSGDVLVLPSRAEGVPRTVLEAMASNTPVVVSDLKQMKSIVGEMGVTVHTGKVSGFTEGLLEVIKSDSIASHSSIIESYSWEKTVQQTTDVLNQFVSNE